MVITHSIEPGGAPAHASTARRTAFRAALALAIALPMAAVGLTFDSAPRAAADNCTGITATIGAPLPACIPGVSGGSVSAGAPSEGLITAKNRCNLIFGGCSSAFFYPQGSASPPNVDTTVRHSP